MSSEMDAPTVARILERQFPELAPTGVAYLGAGMDSVAFEVNGRWVFRFPMRPAVERQLLVERALLPRLALLLPVATPTFEFHGVPDADFPRHFEGYAKLPGVPGVKIESKDVAFDAVARQIGEFLTALHRFPVAEAQRFGAEISRMEDYFDEVRASALDGLPVVGRVAPSDLIDRVQRYLESLRALAAAPWPLVLTHHDLHAEHVLLNTTADRVTGVIDWGDVSIADPTVDFVGLFTWGGESLVRAVLSNYQGPADERVIERLPPWSAFQAVQDIRFGLDNDQPEIVEHGVRALENELQRL
jgi:aminoglycoside phosphotransferase (APT) family kinase protein